MKTYSENILFGNTPFNKDVIDDVWKLRPDSFEEMAEYQSWFDNCGSLDETIKRGIIDFHTKIMGADVYRLIGNPCEKVALEIGYGGGRLLSAASTIFKSVVGIDILNEKSVNMTKKFLEITNRKNFKLFDEKETEKIEDESVDFVYSFIVFQHFSSIEYFHKYMSLIKRVLKPGGTANIFFGMPSFNLREEIVNHISEAGFFHWHGGFNPDEHRSTLFYSHEWVVEQVNSVYNFETKVCARPLKQPWSSPDQVSSQFCVIFNKPRI